MIKYVFFDFDGTIADSKNLIIAVFNKLANKYEFDSISADNIDRLKSMTINERLKYLHVPITSIPALTFKFLLEYKAQSEKVLIVRGMPEVLEQINKSGVGIIIVSSNSKRTIQRVLTNHKLDFINDIYCSSRLFEKHEVIKKGLRKKNIKPSDAIYVGDERRDIMACKIAGLKSIWVSWGLDEINKTSRPDFIANFPEEIMDILKLNF
jgi:phosphoglycolate phosphatase